MCEPHVSIRKCSGCPVRQSSVQSRLWPDFIAPKPAQPRITQLKSELQDAERRQSEEIATLAGDEPWPAISASAEGAAALWASEVRKLEQQIKIYNDLLRGKSQDSGSVM